MAQFPEPPYAPRCPCIRRSHSVLLEDTRDCLKCPPALWRIGRYSGSLAILCCDEKLSNYPWICLPVQFNLHGGSRFPGYDTWHLFGSKLCGDAWRKQVSRIRYFACVRIQVFWRCAIASRGDLLLSPVDSRLTAKES